MMALEFNYSTRWILRESIQIWHRIWQTMTAHPPLISTVNAIKIRKSGNRDLPNHFTAILTRNRALATAFYRTYGRGRREVGVPHNCHHYRCFLAIGFGGYLLDLYREVCSSITMNKQSGRTEWIGGGGWDAILGWLAEVVYLYIPLNYFCCLLLTLRNTVALVDHGGIVEQTRRVALINYDAQW